MLLIDIDLEGFVFIDIQFDLFALVLFRVDIEGF